MSATKIFGTFFLPGPTEVRVSGQLGSITQSAADEVVPLFCFSRHCQKPDFVSVQRTKRIVELLRDRIVAQRIVGENCIVFPPQLGQSPGEISRRKILDDVSTVLRHERKSSRLLKGEP